MQGEHLWLVDGAHEGHEVTHFRDDPPAVAGHAGPGKDLGIWLALGGSGLMVIGAVLGYARISLAVESREP